MGEPVTISFTIEKLGTPEVPFPLTDSLQLSADAGLPEWRITSVQSASGADTEVRSGNAIIIPGTTLQGQERVNVTFTGSAPSVFIPCVSSEKTKNVTIIRIREINYYDNPVTTSDFAYNITLVNTWDCAPAIDNLKIQLLQFREEINRTASLGVNTSSAEEKYREAENLTDIAETYSQTNKTLYFEKILAALNVISDGASLLDKSWAENSVANASARLDTLDGAIIQLEENETTGNSVQISQLVAQRELAAENLSSAKDALSGNNFSLAREYAQSAFTQANTSYSDALKLQKQTADHKNSLPLSGTGTCLAVMSATAILLMIKTRKDP